MWGNMALSAIQISHATGTRTPHASTDAQQRKSPIVHPRSNVTAHTWLAPTRCRQQKIKLVHRTRVGVTGRPRTPSIGLRSWWIVSIMISRRRATSLKHVMRHCTGHSSNEIISIIKYGRQILHEHM